MKWANKNVFVTGATGLLGSWLCEKLIDLGANVTVLIRDRVPTSNFFNTNYNVVYGELLDRYLIERALNEYDIDTIFNLGAQTQVSTANRNPLSTLETNIRGSWNVFESARILGSIDKIVQASSDKSYGIHEKLPYKEDARLNGIYPYDVSKSCVDLIAQMYSKTFNLPVNITRCGNIFGGGDRNPKRLIPRVIRHFLQNKPFTLRSDGSPIRDFVYVEDIVDGYLKVAESIKPNFHGEAFNLSLNQPRSVWEVVLKIKELMNVDVEVKRGPKIDAEIPAQHLDSTKARTMLGWQPKYTFEEGLKKTIKWYREWEHD